MYTDNQEEYKKVSIEEIEDNRVGGAIGLTGFSYQCLYSAYILLDKVTTEAETIRFEGIEDIDMYNLNGIQIKNHIQVKFSQDRQNASYMKDILKNYLEIYLINQTDTSRYYTLVYDFEIADGQFKNLIEKEPEMDLDQKAEQYWLKVIDKIRGDSPRWDWKNFNINNFFRQLRFKRVKSENLISSIRKLLIKRYDIYSGNEVLYGHSLFYLCFSKMKERETMNKQELDKYILSVSEAINKGNKNPAYKWLREVKFEYVSKANDDTYFEGKKATPSDIISGYPVDREVMESNIKASIAQNDITVIKAASGQGKTTLAWKALYELRSCYSILHLTWCSDTKELNNIIQFVKSRIKVGEIPLLLLDNLNVELSQWNYLAQLLQQEIGTNYKILITSREEDWFHYAGDQSAIRGLEVIEVYLNQKEAKEIYQSLRRNERLHSSISNWESSWEQVQNSGLLIEYVYLLTQGEMLSERINSQMARISSEDQSGVKYDVLSKICLADTMGVSVTVERLIGFYQLRGKFNITQVLNEMEKEYFIKRAENDRYFTGIHPIRSQHILDCISNLSKQNIIFDLLSLVDNLYIASLYSNIPFHIYEEKEHFYENLVIETIGQSYEFHLNAIRGLFSGSILRYYNSNKYYFDEVNTLGGLFPFLIEINPYSNFKGFNEKLEVLTDLAKIHPNDTHIKRLKKLAEEIPKFNIKKSDYYYYAHYLSINLKKEQKIKQDYFATLNYWLVTTDDSFGLVDKDFIKEAWRDRNEWSISSFADLMLAYYLSHKESYIEFIKDKKSDLLDFLTVKTDSIKVRESDDKNNLYVEYILMPTDYDKGNIESVKRIKLLCKSLPIYDFYQSESIKPKIELFEDYRMIDDSAKNMPKRNIILMFHKEFAKLWQNTILTNYEASTVFDWINHWINIRQDIVNLFRKNIQWLERILNGQKMSNNALKEIDMLRDRIITTLRMNYNYPGENRPFRKDKYIPTDISKVENRYFSSIRNYINQMVGIVVRDEKNSKLAMYNLLNAKNQLEEIHKFFNQIILRSGHRFEGSFNLQEKEIASIEKLYMYNLYYINQPNSRVATGSIIKSWYSNYSKRLIIELRQKIGTIKSEDIRITYPDEVIRADALSYLPLLVENANIFSDEYNGKLIFSLLPVIDFNIDFVIVMFVDESGRMIEEQGIRISKNYLEAVNISIVEDNATALEKQNPPFPIEVERSYLKPFKSSFYEIKERPKDVFQKYEELFLILWKYSQIRQDLDNEKFKTHINEKRQKLRERVDVLLSEIQLTNDYLIHKAKDYSERVFNDDYIFDDKDLNELYSVLIERYNRYEL